MDKITSRLPEHIAIILDGDGRWATRRGLPRYLGHAAGMLNGIKIIEHIASLNSIPILTFFILGIANKKRPEFEYGHLNKVIKYAFKKFLNRLNKKNVKIRVIGDIQNLSPDYQTLIEHATQLTGNNTGLTLILAINYGGQRDIVLAVRSILQKAAKQEITEADITEEIFSSFLSTSGIPDPDLLIRTGAEIRLSDFMLWQLAYTEFYFTDIMWPDFNKAELEKALEAYTKRERRFGAKPNS